MALYPPAVKRLIPLGPNDPPIKPRVVILHVADTEATTLFDYFNGPSGGVESHFYIRRDGTLDQYRDTSRQADANVMANDFAISIETQGRAAGQWTPQQLDAIKALLTWCHKVHGIPLTVPKTWDGSGVGYHILFEAQWDQRGASCPGPDRIKQFQNVLVPWMAGTTQEEDMANVSDAQLKLLLDAANRVLASGTASPRLLNDADGAQLRKDIGYVRDQIRGDLSNLSAQQLADSIPDNLAQQVVDLLATRLKRA